MRNMKIITCLLTITSLVFTACGGGSNDIEKAKSVATTEHLKRYTEAISHDSCQGRKPFSEGADRAVNYIAHQMKEVGLKPINGDSYFQQVRRHRNPPGDRKPKTGQRRFLFPTG